MVLYKNDETKIIEDSVFDISKKGDTLIAIYKNFDKKNQTGDYIEYDLKSNNERIKIEGIMTAQEIAKDKYLISKDYSSSSETYSLYIKSGKKEKLLEYNVIKDKIN